MSRDPSARSANARWSGAALVLVFVAAVVQAASPAGADKRLDHLKGVVGFQAAAAAPFRRVFGRELLADDAFAITQGNSAGEIALPDSSLVALGENTRVQVGAFNDGAAGPGATIAVLGGSLRFDIKRPQGGAANYRFTTTTSQIAIRGTVGLISFLGGNTTIACLVCAADSVTLTVGTQTIALAAGQFVTVGAAGTIVTGAVSSGLLGTFTAAQVSIATASGPAAATAGIAGIAAPGGVAGGGIAAAAALAGAAAGIAISSAQHAPAPAASAQAPTPAPTAMLTASPTSAPAPAPTTSANVGIERKRPGERHR